ncbi:hypothetical protein DPMN_006987 [Dreissena polymorpha]|uniref:Uncharacterized protein n=1 Tax=Dreissena polymorpha TaxID=45954 RepID=A0A9D4MWG5_DREPO|nr:hypothetical protein DPMN_006987 [Dreissena polymorpha]
MAALVVGAYALVKKILSCDDDDDDLLARLRGCLRSVNARVFTNQMWTDGRQTKTNPKTSPDQSAIFQLLREINKTNALTKFHDDWKTAPPPWRPSLKALKSHVIQLTGTIFVLNYPKNVTSRVFTCFHYILIEKNSPSTSGHVFSPIGTIFKLVRDINKTNALTNFHDDRTKTVPSRVFTNKC